jgi:uncharacterized membrane protein
MGDFAIALAVFIGLHVGLSATGLRQRLVGAIGEPIYRGGFALASAGVLVWMVMAYGEARLDLANSLLYAPPSWARHITHSLMLVSFLFVVAGLLTPGPTQAGFEGSLAKAEPATGILRVTRHPFLWGVAIWGLAHLISNGDRAGVMLFGGLGLMVLFGTRSIDRKGVARDRERWAAFAAVTSNIPFAAIVQRRNRLVFAEMWWRLLVALLAFAAVGYFHATLFGVAAFTITS